MTDKGIADKVYMEPLTEEALEQILERNVRTACWQDLEDRQG